jgi:signal transduction histidine kinase
MDTKPFILIVDDQLTNRELLKDVITTMGYDSQQAESGKEALVMMERKAPDLVLLDILMSGLDGYETLDRMKADDHLRHIPVIMITALDDIDSVVRCIEIGADDYLSKPFNPTLLKARIHGSLEKKLFHDREQQLHEDLKSSYEALQRAEQARDSLLHMIVHDMRSPLTNIMGSLEVFKILNKNLNEDGNKLIDGALRGSKKLVSMINSLLDINRMESGEMLLDIVEKDLSKIVTEAIELVGGQLGSAHIIFEPAPKIFIGNFDPDIISRVISNLIDNALKFTPEDEEVRIKLDQNDAELIFTITDNGPGIPIEFHQKIFDKFGQVEMKIKHSVCSSGIGLAFCKLAVEAHKGEISVVSEVGKGSAFVFTLPRQTQSEDRQ